MENSPIIQITDGQVKGTIDKNFDGENYYSFYGIPYGEAPIGELRFKAPLTVKPWQGIRDTSKEINNHCYQQDAFSTSYNGSEDCLNLNVFTRQLPKSEEKSNGLKPVMVYIYGGAFIVGSNSLSMYNPEYLMTKDVVLVTINYRVGILGFLSLKNPKLNVPGNAGLKDQLLALKWVKNNIKYFNGDANKVTIFGGSAGGASVHFHVVSKSSSGLFHKAIIQSGSVLNPWPYNDENNVENVVKHLGQVEGKNEEEFYAMLKDANVDELVRAQNEYSNEKGTFLRIFGPVIEQPNPTAFLTENPIEVITKGRYNCVPMIFSYAIEEGLITEFIQSIKGKMINKIDEFIPFQMKLEENDDNFVKAVEILTEFYGKYNKYTLAGDSLFVAGIIGALKNHVKTNPKNPVYLYRMSLVAKQNFSRNIIKTPLDENAGAAHGDDLMYIWSSKFIANQLEVGTIEEVTVRRFIEMLTNFAYHGNPCGKNDKYLNVKWPQFNDKEEFLDIYRELKILKNPESDRMEIWKQIYKLSPHTELFLP